MLALDSPFSGRCFENEITRSPDTIDASALHMVGIEPEIALRISKDFEPFQGWRAENVIPYIDAVIPAIEVVESRFSTWPLMGFLSAIADNGVHRRLVLGDPITHWTPEQIEGAHVILKANDQVVRQGYADNVDGGPFGVIAWLANHLNDLGTTLNAGDIVSTGVMTDIYDSAPGETLVAEYDLPAHVHLNIT
jgi:2-keto-4-pentenoate hydratase